jgi:hypothetical protein
MLARKKVLIYQISFHRSNLRKLRRRKRSSRKLGSMMMIQLQFFQLTIKELVLKEIFIRIHLTTQSKMMMKMSTKNKPLWKKKNAMNNSPR